MMEANKDPWTGAWRWIETLGKPMAEVPEPVWQDLMKLRRIYPEVQEMVDHPAASRGAHVSHDPDAD